MTDRKSDVFEPLHSFEDFFQLAEQKTDYWVELAKLDFTKEVLARMNDLDINKTALARRLNVRPGLVTRLLSGQNNFELSTMVRIARALDSEFRCHLQPKGTLTRWINLQQTEVGNLNLTPWNSQEYWRITTIHSPKVEDETITAAA